MGEELDANALEKRAMLQAFIDDELVDWEAEARANPETVTIHT